jgi:hypothetical protein
MTMRTDVQFVSIETHVDCLVWDPFPTIDKLRYDGCSREAIVAACVEKYAAFPIPGALISITIFDISVVNVGGVKYRSEPLNKSTWSKNVV